MISSSVDTQSSNQLMALVVPLVVVALLSYYILHLSAQPSPVDRFWINGDDGVDNSTCGPAGSPCKSLFYVVNEIYRDNNLSYVEIELQSNLLYETCEVTHAFLSTVIIVCYHMFTTVSPCLHFYPAH